MAKNHLDLWKVNFLYPTPPDSQPPLAPPPVLHFGKILRKTWRGIVSDSLLRRTIPFGDATFRGYAARSPALFYFATQKASLPDLKRRTPPYSPLRGLTFVKHAPFLTGSSRGLRLTPLHWWSPKGIVRLLQLETVPVFRDHTPSSFAHLASLPLKCDSYATSFAWWGKTDCILLSEIINRNEQNKNHCCNHHTDVKPVCKSFFG